jgi:hypothetical protein
VATTERAAVRSRVAVVATALSTARGASWEALPYPTETITQIFIALTHVHG